MDSLLIALLDALFHGLGKMFVKLVERTGVSTGYWSWGGYVVVDFMGFVMLCILMLFIAAAALKWTDKV